MTEPSQGAPLLLEIGCEEIPARMLREGAEDLSRRVVSLLDDAGIGHGEARALWTPRRLVVRIDRVAPAAPLRSETITGPPSRAAWDGEGRPTKAATGFARRHGREAADLVQVETPRGPYAALEVESGGETPARVLARELPAAVGDMTFPKMMRWGAGTYRFVRPIHWILALHGGEEIALDLFGVRSARITRGHRFLGPAAVPVDHPDHYEDALRKAGVVVDPDERRRRIEESALALGSGTGGTLVADPGLLEEVADGVEYPGVILGQYPERFCRLPVPILRTTLRHHQKAFSVAGDDDRLAPWFVVAVNTDRDPEGHVQRGNEWVVIGRLEDAEFFYREDRKRTLEEWAQGLEQVTFHASLGSYAAKARRMERLVDFLGEHQGVTGSELREAQRAARLAKADLVTGIVGEFPELQGVAGGIYAAEDGDPSGVAEAVAAHYRPHGPDDGVPPRGSATLVALADRLDTLVGCHGAGMRATGSKDPFGLRRDALGLLRTILERQVDLDLCQAVDQAADGFGPGTGSPGLPSAWSAEGRGRLLAFLEERFAFLLGEAGMRYDEVAAVAAACRGTLHPIDRRARAEALRSIRGNPDFLSLAVAAKRIRNILAQAREAGEESTREVSEESLEEAAEQHLFQQSEALAAKTRQSVQAQRYSEVLSAIATLQPVVDRFFEEILVMDPDPDCRVRRLALLARVGTLLHSVVDFSEIVVEGEEAAREAVPAPRRNQR